MAESQVTALMRRLPQPKPSDSRAPRVIIKSALILDRDTEDRLMEMSRANLANLSSQLGRIDYTDPAWISNATTGRLRRGSELPFFAKRHLAHMVYQMRMDWRDTMLGGIWSKSNHHLPLTRRTVQQQIARAVAYFFGTTPWFSANPKPTAQPWDQTFAKKCDQWSKFEAKESGLMQTLVSTLHLAFIQGEQVTKTQYDLHQSFYKTYLDVACTPDGKPFIAQDGDYVTAADKFVPYQPPPPPADGSQPPVPAADPTQMQFVLARDGRTPPPAVPLHYERILVERRVTHFAGARTRNVHFMDFLCPLTARDVERAPFVYELYSEPLMNVINRFIEAANLQQSMTAEEQVQAISALCHQFQSGNGSKGGASPGQNQAAAGAPRAEQGEAPASLGADNVEPDLDMAECYHHFSVNNDGILNSIVLITDKDHKVPIYYDYVANVTPDGLRPYTVHRVNEVDGRWHGQGQVETYQDLQHAADLLFNRWNFSQMSAGRVDFWSPWLTVEGSRDPNLKMNFGMSYTLLPNADPDKVLRSEYLREIKGADLSQLLQLIMQMFTNMGGVANANDSRMAGLDTGELATGINNIQASGEELFGKFVQELQPTMEQATQRHIKLTLAHLDKARVFQYFDYDRDSQQMVQRLDSFTPAEAAGLDITVDISLTRFENMKQEQQGLKGMQVIGQYYALPPIVQQRASSAAQKALSAYGYNNVDDIIQPLTPEEFQQMPQQQQGQAASGPAPFAPPRNPATVAATPPPQAPIAAI